MKVEAVGAGVKLTYTIVSAQTPVGQIMTVLTQLGRQGRSGNTRRQTKRSDDGYPIG